MSSNDIIDLDALVPEKRKIKFNDEIIEVNPPSTANILRLSKSAVTLSEAGDVDTDELQKATETIEACIKDIIPELKEATLSTNQLLSLMTLINDMALPQDDKKLKEQGVTLDGSKKA